MSATQVRLYKVIDANDATNYAEFKCLTTKEKEFVVSELFVSPVLQAKIDGADADHEMGRFDFKEGETYTEQTLIDWAQLIFDESGDEMAVIQELPVEETIHEI